MPVCLALYGRVRRLTADKQLFVSRAAVDGPLFAYVTRLQSECVLDCLGSRNELLTQGSRNFTNYTCHSTFYVYTHP